jgi:SAM-dependent methyltransferase
VPPRYGPLYSASVLRPIAEQLLEALDVQPGQTACDLVCDGGVLTCELARAVAPHGTVFAADVDVDLARSVAGAASSDTGSVRAIALRAGRVPLDDHACDRVGSLLTVGFAPALLAEARRTVKADGHMVIAMWDPDSPPAHELALRSALQGFAGRSSPFLSAVLWATSVEGLQISRIRDVARFDGAAHLWAALVDERPIARELADLPADVVSAVREQLALALARYAAPDGTLRIPVQALLAS